MGDPGEMEFDPAKKYQVQEDVFFDDGREIELLHFIYNHEDIENIRDNPSKVLRAIDEFARTKKYLMNVGEDKGRIVSDLVKERRPETMVELGGYVGYSSVLFGAALRDSGGRRYWVLERNPEFAAVTASMVSLAGLDDVVKVVVGPSDASIKRLYASGGFPVDGNIDMMFLDHFKPAYTPDLKLCEELGLISEGTVLAADNVIKPGNPPYLEYVRSTVDEKREAAKNAKANGADPRFKHETLSQYKHERDEETIRAEIGDPNLVYESRMINSWEPSGVPDALEVTRCVGIKVA